MCLIAVAYKTHPDYPLLVVANRDEFHARPAEALSWWPDNPGVLAGRDIEQGGTWMGVSENGRWSAVTNFREPESTDNGSAFLSRGMLPLNFLNARFASQEYMESLSACADSYRGYSLLVYDGDALFYYSNRENRVRLLSPGIYGLSNHLVNTPWPKVQRVCDGLNTLLNQYPLQHDDLLPMMTDLSGVPEHELPVTGVGSDLERFLSPCFIRGEQYGTRSTSSVLYGKNGQMTVSEQGWSVSGEKAEFRQFVIDVCRN